MLNAYTIVFAALLVPAGRLGDRYGNKGGFVVGLLLFTLSSLGCALSSNLWLIVVFRVIQAVGGAILVPTSLGLILTTIPGERRQTAIKIWAILGSVGAAAGPAVGGLLVEASWRWIFIVNVPIGIAAAAATVSLVPDVRHNRETSIPDMLGGALLVVSIAALALGLVQAPDWGWGSTRTVIAFVVAVVAGLLFVARSLRAKAPVIDFSLFRDRTFAWANCAMLFTNLAFGLQLLGLILWMQNGWHWSALDTGLGIAPGPVAVSIAALGLGPQVKKLKLPNGVVAAAGVLLMAVGGVLIATSISPDANYAADVLPGWMIVGAGVGFSIPFMIAAGSANLRPHQTSTGSAVLQMGRWIGSTIGVSLLVVVLGSAAADGHSVHPFIHAWWWAVIPATLGAIACLGLTETEFAQPSAAVASSH